MTARGRSRNFAWELTRRRRGGDLDRIGQALFDAALVLGQYWAERRRRLLVICPASLRKQWATELVEKFHLPTQVLDTRTLTQTRRDGVYNPFDQDVISIVSFGFAARMERTIGAIRWDLAVIDEAHKLRNAYRESHCTGQVIKRGLVGGARFS